MKALIVVDMQNDFTTGVLGNPQTAAVVKNVADTIKKFRKNEPDGLIIATLDTHFENYSETQEGRNLPVPHCIKGSEGWEIVPEIKKALGKSCTYAEKLTFGKYDLPELIGMDADIEEFIVIGVCTDICVISNVMILKAAYPEVPVRVIADSCAGVSPESHENALSAMKVCQVRVDDKY